MLIMIKIKLKIKIMVQDIINFLYEHTSMVFVAVASIIGTLFSYVILATMEKNKNN